MAAAGLLDCSLTTMILRGSRCDANVMPQLIRQEIERLAPAKVPSCCHESCITILRRWRGSLRRAAIFACAAFETSKRSKLVHATDGSAGKGPHCASDRRHRPLLGLIGAVSGLVHVFSHLGLSGGASDTRQIALGIAEALNATVFGLSIAVPTLIGFTYFSRKVEVMSVEMETLVVELINKLYYGRSSREFETGNGRPPHNYRSD